jgi:DedD protein
MEKITISIKRGETAMEDKLKQPVKKSNDLSDIVLEKEKSNVDKTKKMLLFAATLILLFLIGLVVMKLFNNAPQGEEDNLAQVGEQMVQPVDQSIDQLSKKVEDTNDLFQQEPIIDDGAETDLKFEEMVRKLKAQDMGEEVKKSEPVAETKPVEKKVEKKVDETKDLFSKKVDEIAKAAAKTKKESVQKVEEVKTAVSEVVTPKVVKPAPVKPKKVITPPKEIIIDTKVTPVPSETKFSTLSGYFIQVGATTASFPDRRYLQKIKNAGYDYVVHSTVVKGRKIKKILIGPFASKSEAKRKLPGVQSSINPSAYVYRVK